MSANDQAQGRDRVPAERGARGMNKVDSLLSLTRPKQAERGLRSGNIVVNGHRTSIRLEPEMWTALSEIAAADGVRVNEMVSRIAALARAGSLTSAVRVFIMGYYRSKAHALTTQSSNA
jgi:predicted DNA-binding ribbon-helix-helix protein